MQKTTNESFEYLCVGHITKDLVENGDLTGGTAAFSSLTAAAFGLRTALVTAANPQEPPEEMGGIEMHIKPSKSTTTFKNILSPEGRKQYIFKKAQDIQQGDIPDSLLNAHILHLGPIAQEVDPDISNLFANAFLGITPQGWMRSWDQKGLVSFIRWQPSQLLKERTDAVAFSIEDVNADEEYVQHMVHSFRVVAVTEGYHGARIYWNGDVHQVRAPKVPVKDATGAGDIFAAVFFIRLQAGSDPWEAGRQAVRLASQSVTRSGLKSVPTKEEIQTTMIEIL